MGGRPVINQAATRVSSPVRVGRITMDGWASLELPIGWTDTFRLNLSVMSGVPPGDYARVIKRMMKPVFALRPSASLWIQLDGEGVWYKRELKESLKGAQLPMAILNGGRTPEALDFSYRPWVDRLPSPEPPEAEALFDAEGYPLPDQRGLQVLARIGQGYTAEVASLSGFSKTYTRAGLKAMSAAGCIDWIQTETYPYWKIRRSGVSLALRSWGVPAGVSFLERRESGYATSRHQRTARLWPAWVREAWPQVEVWAGWSEVSLGRRHPDALVWGTGEGQEALFWLEVERGKRSREELQARIRKRFNRALLYLRQFKLPLVFVVLGPDWVRETMESVFGEVPEDAAVVLADWRSYGRLPGIKRGKTAL